jgi:hypothetical protein
VVGTIKLEQPAKKTITEHPSLVVVLMAFPNVDKACMVVDGDTDAVIILFWMAEIRKM